MSEAWGWFNRAPPFHYTPMRPNESSSSTPSRASFDSETGSMNASGSVSPMSASALATQSRANGSKPSQEGESPGDQNTHNDVVPSEASQEWASNSLLGGDDLDRSREMYHDYDGASPANYDSEKGLGLTSSRRTTSPRAVSRVLRRLCTVVPRPRSLRFGMMCLSFALMALGAFIYLTLDDAVVVPVRIGPGAGRVDSGSHFDIKGDGTPASESLLQQETEAYALDTDPTHVLVPTRPLRPPPPLLGPVENRLPLDILTSYYTTGVLPVPRIDEGLPVHQADLVYLFVNATDPLFASAIDDKAAEEGLESRRGKVHHWRDNGELRGAVRSGAMAMGERIGNVHLITGAFAPPAALEAEVKDTNGAAKKNEAETERAVVEARADSSLTSIAEARTLWDPVAARVNASDYTLGQIPEWLNYDSRANLRWHAHADLYRLPRDDDGALDSAIAHVDEQQWRAQALPTFNSFEIESRIPWVPGLREQFIMSNDDMFFLQGQAASDFHHPLAGAVTRTDFVLVVKPELTDKVRSSSGEWGGLQHAGLLLSRRFPWRDRGYVLHLPRPISRSVAQEAAVMFAGAGTDSATRAFRESRRGEADISYSWLWTHLRMERWREALLWTWAVARVGGSDGAWGPQARDELRAALGLNGGADVPAVIVIKKGPRQTLDDLQKISRKVGWENPKHTTYKFSSFDGHLLRNPDKEKEKPSLCRFETSDCLPQDFFTNNDTYSAAEMFRRIAFERPGCGDCLIDALVTASGKRGLSAFLPAANATYMPPVTPESQWERSEPILPLTATWQAADFDLESNVRTGQDVWAGAPGAADGSVNLLNWCVKLLSRYVYVWGTMPTRFSIIQNPDQVSKLLNEVSRSNNLALLCLNDNLPDDPTGVNAGKVRVALQNWMKKLFGGASSFIRWERPGLLWGDN